MKFNGCTSSIIHSQLVLAAVFVVSSATLQASPSAITSPSVGIQPDGSEVSVVLKGDANRSWYQTPEGYLITKDEHSRWVYGKFAPSEAKNLTTGYMIRPTSAIVGQHDPRQIGLSVFDGLPASVPQNNLGVHKAVSGGNPISSKLGTVPMLVILGYYDDALSSPNCTRCATTDVDYIQTLFFAAGTQQRSIADFVSTASQGAYIMSPAQEMHGTENDGVVGWLRLGAATPEVAVMSTSVYKSNKIAADAINAAMAHVDFTRYDVDGNGFVDSGELGIIVILGGYEASYGRDENGRSLGDDGLVPRVWGQSRTFVSAFSGVPIPAQSKNGRTVRINTQKDGMTYSIVGELHGDHPLTMGIVTHELGHTLFDLPDLYDTRGASNGVGGWSLMGYGSWGKARSERYPGSTPVMMDAWSRLALGWASIVQPGSGELAALSAESLDVAVVSTPNANEYFLIENRQNQGYDEGLYYFLYTENFGGLAVWHIDDSVGAQNLNNDNANVYRKRVDLVAAQYDERIDAGTSYGHANNLFNANSVSSLSDQTHKDMTLYSGRASGVVISDISIADASMSFMVNYDSSSLNQSTASFSNGLSSLVQGANASGGGGGGGVLGCFALLLLFSLYLRSWFGRISMSRL